MLNLIYAEEQLTDMIPEMKGLVYGHWQEVTGEGPELDPDWEKFEELDKLGISKCIAVRNGAELVGYLVFLICNSLHYRTQKFAHDDAFFLKPEYRKGTAGVKLFREGEKMLKNYGVDRIIIHEKLHRPMGLVLKFLHYQEKEIIWMRNI